MFIIPDTSPSLSFFNTDAKLSLLLSFQLSNEKQKRKERLAKMLLSRIFWWSLSLVLPADSAVSVVPAALDSNYYVYIHTLEPSSSHLEVTVSSISFSTPWWAPQFLFCWKQKSKQVGLVGYYTVLKVVSKQALALENSLFEFIEKKCLRSLKIKKSFFISNMKESKYCGKISEASIHSV